MTGPFAYLKELALNDIHASLSDDAFPVAPADIARALTSDDPATIQAAFALLTRPSPSHPSALANLAMIGKPQTRGLALRVISAMVASAPHSAEAVAHAILSGHFRMREHEITPAILTCWLQSLSETCQSAELQPSPAEALIPPSAVLFRLENAGSDSALADLLFCLHASAPSQDLTEYLYSLVATHPHEGVRIGAISNWTATPHDDEVRCSQFLELLLTLVASPEESLNVRATAYQAIYRATGKPVEEWPDVLEVVADFVFPRDVDWEFLRQLKKSLCSNGDVEDGGTQPDGDGGGRGS